MTCYLSQVEENDHLRIELQRKIQELEKYVSASLVSSDALSFCVACLEVWRMIAFRLIYEFSSFHIGAANSFPSIFVIVETYKVYLYSCIFCIFTVFEILTEINGAKNSR